MESTLSAGVTRLQASAGRNVGGAGPVEGWVNLSGLNKLSSNSLSFWETALGGPSLGYVTLGGRESASDLD